MESAGSKLYAARFRRRVLERLVAAIRDSVLKAYEQEATGIAFRRARSVCSINEKRKQNRNDKSSRLFLCNLKQWRCRCVKSYSGQRWLCCLPQALSAFRLLKALAALGVVVLAREPEQEPELPVVRALVVLVVVLLGQVAPVPVLAVQALLLAELVVLAARRPEAPTRLAIQAREQTAGGRARAFRPSRVEAMWNRASKAAPGHG